MKKILKKILNAIFVKKGFRNTKFFDKNYTFLEALGRLRIRHPKKISFLGEKIIDFINYTFLLVNKTVDVCEYKYIEKWNP